jgi:hypothetical protein
MITVHVADKERVDFSKARVLGPGDGAAGVVKNPCAVRILENHGTVELAEIAVMAA